MAAYLARFNYEIVKPVRSATRYPSPTQRSAPSRTQDERIARSVMTNTDYVGVTTHGTRIAAARLSEGATNRQRPQMRERRIAHIVGLALGLIFASALILNALAF